MGQAFRRAAGRLRTTSVDTPSSSSSSSTPSRFQNSIDQRPPPVLPTDPNLHIQHNVPTNLDDNSKSNAQGFEERDIGEDRDSNYDAMLNKMVGRISTKPGGKLEMGEAFVVRKSNRPMPKLRNTTPEAGSYEQRPVAAGTLNVAQLRHIMLLHRGKAEGRDEPLGPKEIAERFRLDPAQIERIFHFVSMPAEDSTKKT